MEQAGLRHSGLEAEVAAAMAAAERVVVAAVLVALSTPASA